MPYMYILECADGSFYTGSTKDLERRLWEHQNGLGAHHTAKRLPVKLVYCEEYDRIDDAFYREKQVQGWSRKKKEALMASDYNQIHLLAECRNETHFAGFDSLRLRSVQAAQPTDSAQPASQETDNRSRSLSGVEIKGGSLSGVEGNTAKPNNLSLSLSRRLSEVETGVETSTELKGMVG